MGSEKVQKKNKSILETLQNTKIDELYEKSKQQNPFFTVVIPTYNQAEFLTPAVDSVFAQTFSDWEIVIVNDGSKDNTAEVMETLAKRDKRIKCFNKENGGVATALNEGIKNASGQWICWLSSDDLFEPDKLEIHFNAINEHPEIKFFHSHWYLLLHETNQKISPGLWLPIPKKEFQVLHFFISNYVHGNAIAVHKTVFEKVGLFNEQLRMGQDFDMWLRISAMYESYFINKRTCVTRIHEGQTTNSFTEGGVLDSNRSLFKFTNSKKFEELFPHSNLKDEKEAFKCLCEIIDVVTKHSGFMYRCGYNTMLVDKTIDWLNNGISPKIKKNIISNFEQVAKSVNKNYYYPEIHEILKNFEKISKYKYGKHEIFDVTLKNIAESLKIGNQEKVSDLERFLVSIAPHEKLPDGSARKYTPQVLGYLKNETAEPLDLISVKSWIIEPVTIAENKVAHRIAVACPHCQAEFNVYSKFPLEMQAQSKNFICPSCKTSYSISDNNYHDFLIKYNDKLVSNYSVQDTPKRIAYYIPLTDVIGGGINIVYQHLKWLDELGYKIIVYSQTNPPNWTKLPGEFKKVKSYSEIDENDFDLIVVFSIFDVPKVFHKVKKERIIHLCQGYEGYHYGRTFEEMRADKFILTEIHKLPNKALVVSEHLQELFDHLLNKETELVANFIDHKTFYPQNLAKTKNSILFLGNPAHPLKGFDFLAQTLSIIQKSQYRLDDLIIYVATGNKYIDAKHLKNELKTFYGVDVEIFVELESPKVAELINKVEITICSSWYEGFSLPLLESMACGTPVITTNNMGAESFCKNRFNSIVVPYGRQDLFGAAILEIIKKAFDVNLMIENGKKTAAEYTKERAKSELQTAFSHFFEPKKIVNTENVETTSQCFYEVSIVIPTFNQWKYTKQTLDSIEKYTNVSYEIVIVDNASTDETREKLNSFNNIKLVTNDKNLGFPKAVNQGIVEATGKYVMIANNDIVVTEGWLDRMIELIESNPSIGIVGPISNSVSGYQIDENAKYKSIPEMHTYAKSVSKKNKGKVLDFPRVAFLCTLIKKEVIEKIGGLDERFSPGNYEDDDYCLRAQLVGYKTVIAQDVFIHHFGSKSFRADGDQKYIDRLNTNKEIFVDKWGADPNDIWLHSKDFNNRKFTVPISKNKFKQNFERGMQHIEEQEFELAAEAFMNSYEFYDEFIESSGYNVPKTEILNLAGNVFLILNLFEEAKILFENQLKLDPESGEACLGLGQVFYEAELYNEAKTMFEYAVEFLPDNANAVLGLQKSNEALGLKSGEKVLDNSNSSGSNATIEDLIDRGELNEAKLAILDELSINGDDTYLLNNLVVINIMQEKYDTAAKLLEKILTIEPNNETAINNLEFLDEKLNSELQIAESMPNSNIEKVEELIEKGEIETAKETLKSILVNNPQNIDALNNLVVVLILEGKLDKASEAILEVLKLDPANEIAKDNLNYLEELVKKGLSEEENK